MICCELHNINVRELRTKLSELLNSLLIHAVGNDIIFVETWLTDNIDTGELPEWFEWGLLPGYLLVILLFHC